MGVGHLIGRGWTVNNVQTLPSDYFPEGAVGSFTGLGGLHTYTPILVVAGLLPIMTTAALFALGGEIRRVSFDNPIRS